MSTIRNDNTTGGGMYAPSQGINTALTNPNGITSATYQSGAGFGGSAEHFVTGNPFKPVPQGFTPYNPALGPTQQPLAPTPTPTPAPAPAPAPAPGGQMGYIPNEEGPVNTTDPSQVYAQMCGDGWPPQEAAKYAISGTMPPGSSTTISGGPYNSTLVPPPAAPIGPQIEEHGGPIQGEAQLGGRQQRGGQYDTTYGGNGTLLSNLLGQRGYGGYGYGQGSNVSMMQALQGGGGQGYGDFLSQLLARYGK